MSNVQVEGQLSIGELLKAVEQLSQPELEEFVSQAITLRARRRAPSLLQREVELLIKIDQAIPPKVHKRYGELTAKRRSQALKIADKEYNELLQLTNLVEKLDAQRLRYLVELADLRRVSFSDLIDSLGIES